MKQDYGEPKRAANLKEVVKDRAKEANTNLCDPGEIVRDQESPIQRTSSTVVVNCFGSGFDVAAQTCAAYPVPPARSRSLVGLRPLGKLATRLPLRPMAYRLLQAPLPPRVKRRELQLEELYRLVVALVPKPAPRLPSRAPGLAVLPLKLPTVHCWSSQTRVRPGYLEQLRALTGNSLASVAPLEPMRPRFPSNRCQPAHVG